MNSPPSPAIIIIINYSSNPNQGNKRVEKDTKTTGAFYNMFPFGDNSLQLQPSFKKPPFQLYDQIQNPIISKHDNDDSPFFSNFPSPFFDEHELLPFNHIFPNFTSKPAIANPPLPSSSDHTPKIQKDPPKLKHKITAAPPRRRGLAVAAAPRKRTGKKDRHSKICTAQGIRDRRMRLSLQVARKFFDLQDLLGYDKASKTIEWLFNKSKKAIKELAKDVSVRGGNNVSLSDAKSESFVSECEVVSGIEENCSNNEVKGEGSLMAAEEDDKNGSFEKNLRRSACIPNTKESREKARARARCRTKEKMMAKLRVGEMSPNCADLEKLGSSSNIPFNGGDDDDDQERVPAFDAGDYFPLLQSQPPSDVGTIEKLLGSSTSDYPNTSFMGFLGNWDLLSNDKLGPFAVPNPQATLAAGYY